MEEISLERGTLSVRQTIEYCNGLLQGLPIILQGEVVEYRVNQDKFVFFKLKDDDGMAVVDCFMMKFALPIPLEDGMKLRVIAEPKIQTKTGKFGLTIKKLMVVGEGGLKRAFEQLKNTLQAEGLFSAARKRQLPRYPRSIAIISSKDAAGFGDFMRIIQQRLPGVRCTLFNAAVQGMRAEKELIQALQTANDRADFDVVVMIRGGGSTEDLQVFNTETLARAIVRSRIPVMVGVGHERDVSIADYCADVRAATPTNAAQLLIPTREEFTAYITGLQQRARYAIAGQIAQKQSQLHNQTQRMHQAIHNRIHDYRQKSALLEARIASLSPHAVLERGYALVTNQAGVVFPRGQDIPLEEQVQIHFSDIQIQATINSK
jgi:exodeoxyribonuclease VII large subunit